MSTITLRAHMDLSSDKKNTKNTKNTKNEEWKREWRCDLNQKTDEILLKKNDFWRLNWCSHEEGRSLDPVEEEPQHLYLHTIQPHFQRHVIAVLNSNNSARGV